MEISVHGLGWTRIHLLAIGSEGLERQGPDNVSDFHISYASVLFIQDIHVRVCHLRR
jgi:hypothetical protein